MLAGLIGLTGLAGCGGTNNGGTNNSVADGARLSVPCKVKPSKPAPTVTAGATMYATPPGMDEVFKQIDEQSDDGRFADVFAGIKVVPEEGYAIVYRKPSDEFDAFIAQISAGLCVEIWDAPFSLNELVALVERINGDAEYWRGRGIPINMVGPKPDASGVTVGTTEVEQAKVELPKRYGTGIPLFVQKEEPGVLLDLPRS